MIYRIVAGTAFLLMCALLVLSSRKYFSDMVARFKESQGLSGFLRILIYLIMVFSFLVMGISSIIPVMAGAGELSGVMLIIHVVLAPVFIGSLAVFMILTVYRMEFDSDDLKKIRSRRMSRSDIIWQKLIFWLFATAAATGALAIIPMLFPIFGSGGMEVLLDIHRIASVIMVLTAAVHFWLLRPLIEPDN
jgi:ABC-type transport system involved in multi-copper enzyme maturation permease subunit